MILDPNRSARRGRASAAVCLALLTGTVLGVGAAMPVPFAPWNGAAAADPKPAEPARAPAIEARAKAVPEAGLSACREGTEPFGDHDGDFVVQGSVGDEHRLCARVRGPVRFDERDGSIRELSPGGSVLVETRARRARSQRMLVTLEQGERRYQWWVDGAAKDPDDAAHAWLANALEVIAAYRAIGSLQGQVGSLQGEIGSIQGEVGSLQGQIGSVQGQIGSLQGRIGTIQGEQGSLQGAIGSHQGAIGGLQGSRSRAGDAQQARIDQQIREHEAAIRKLEAEIERGEIARRMAAAEAELRTFEKEAQRQIADIEQQMKGVRAEERISGLEQQIEDLHADERILEIERRMKPALERLKKDIDRIGR